MDKVWIVVSWNDTGKGGPIYVGSSEEKCQSFIDSHSWHNTPSIEEFTVDSEY